MTKIEDALYEKEIEAKYGHIKQEDIDQHDDEFYDLAENSERKPCPFCGSDDIKVAVYLRCIDSGNFYHLYSIFCCECGVSNSNDDPKELFSWWNTRDGNDDQD